MEVVVTTDTVRCAKLQSNLHHQQIDTQFFTGWMHFLSLSRDVNARSTSFMKKNKIHLNLWFHSKTEFINICWIIHSQQECFFPVLV